MTLLRDVVLWPTKWVLAAALLPFILWARTRPRSRQTKPRLFWGTTSIVSLPMNARALRTKGFKSDAVALANPGFPVPDGFTTVISETGAEAWTQRRLVGTYKALNAFISALNNYDIFHLFFTGGLLRKTPLALLEIRLLRLAGKQVIMFPYGSDAFAISRIPYKHWREALLADYPDLARQDRAIAARIDAFSADADMVVGCLVHLATLPTWDALMLTCYPVETDRFQPVYPDLHNETLRITHAPNHRAIKGTEHLIEAVETLQSEGLPVELDLIERQPHAEVMERMAKADVVVDQLIFGYGLTAMEAMALGKVVITGENPEGHNALFADSGIQACPAIWASPETICDVLRNLQANREELRERAIASRAFAECYHAPDATARNWMALYAGLGWSWN